MEQLIGGIFGLLLGVVGMFVFVTLVRRCSEFKHWPTVPGRVIERGTHLINFASVSGPAYKHAPLVRYVYNVNGQQFISNTILPERVQREMHSGKRWAEKRSKEFPDDVTVHFNPENPGESYLVLTSNVTLAIVLLVSLFLLAFGGAFLFVWFVR